MTTIKFFTDNKIYKGWQSLKNTTWLEIKSWLNSGNSVIVNDQAFKRGSIKKFYNQYGKDLI